jgi:hypothetical protein
MHSTTSPSLPPSSEATYYEAIGHIWNQTGESFLAELVRRLATLTDARAAMVVQLQPNSTDRMSSVTAWVDGAPRSASSTSLPARPANA